jgi:phospholipid-binding lipoprotein MlaA
VRRCEIRGGIGSAWLLAGALTVLLSGCGTFSAGIKTDAALRGGAPLADVPTATVDPAATRVLAPSISTGEVSGEPLAERAEPGTIIEDLSPLPAEPILLSLAEPELPARDNAGGSALAQAVQESTEAIEEEYDPWEPFNERMFAFNRGLDRWILKPAARAYMYVMPEPFQILIANGFDNINFVPRFVNSLLQGKWGGAGRELSRFLINSTFGIGGLFDPAKDYWGIVKSREDFGQTLGVWGSGPGPYVIVPFMEPLTVRDGIGKFVDGFMDPLSYIVPFIWSRLGMKLGDMLNERALNYDLFQGFEESVIDMYSAVRHGYLQRRKQLIKE